MNCNDKSSYCVTIYHLTKGRIVMMYLVYCVTIYSLTKGRIVMMEIMSFNDKYNMSHTKINDVNQKMQIH